jgi:hypothetical protein
MTNNARPRHAAQGRASRIAGRAALGVLGAPIAMLAVAGPAGAATLDLNGTADDDAFDVNLAAAGVALPGLDTLGVPALPTELPALPLDGVAFEGVSLDLFDLGGEEGLALPALPAVDGVPALPALPSVDSLPIAGALAAVPVALPVDLPALPAADSLPALPAVGDLGLPTLPAVGDLALPSTDALGALPVALPVDLPALPAADSLPAVGDLAVPALPALPGTDALPALPDAAGTVTGLAGGLPVATTLDLDDVSADLPAAADVFSATDLVSGLI